nr:hypothetical protein [Verrucomicrobiota bacterium]
SSTLGTNRFGGFIRYFSYDVSTNNPAGLAFDLFPLTGDVDLVARLGRLPLPQFDYGSFNFGTNDENITLLPDTVPVPLTPGRWYLGVILADVLPVDYTIQATEYTNSLPFPIRTATWGWRRSRITIASSSPTRWPGCSSRSWEPRRT